MQGEFGGVGYASGALLLSFLSSLRSGLGGLGVEIS
jgi:hypothetical protein